MHVELFKALKQIKLTDDRATEVVEAIEEYIAVKIKEATAGLESQLKAQTWMIGTFGLLLTLIGLAPAIYKLFK